MYFSFNPIFLGSRGLSSDLIAGFIPDRNNYLWSNPGKTFG
jgi:hypothetical protein